MLCPGLRPAVPCGRGDRVPPKNLPPRYPGAFPARPFIGARPPRRGGLRTPASETSLPPGDRPIRSPGIPLPRMIVLCLGLRTASECGRAERVPPRKPPSALSPGFPRKAIRPWLAHPSEGRAPHARGERSRLTGAFVLLATRPSFAHDNHVMPRPPSGPYLRARRARPSEKPSPTLSRGFPRKAIRPWLAHPSEGWAPHARKEGIT
jgi:hypothetical protein